MRAQIGNFFSDSHMYFHPGWKARCYDFVTYCDRNPADVALAIEQVAESVGVPDLVVYGRGQLIKQRRYDRTRDNLDPNAGKDFGSHWFEEVVQMPEGTDISKWGVVNGAVFTSWRTDESQGEPALHVAFTLYDQPCNDSKCMAGHMNKNTGLAYTKAPQLEPWMLEAIEEEIGVHPNYRLGGPNDGKVLSSLGFTPLDCPLLGTKGLKLEDVHTALDYLARTDVGAFVYKSTELLRKGYKLDLGLLQQMVAAHRLDNVRVEV